MKFYKHEASDTVYVLEDGRLYPFSLAFFERLLPDILEKGMSTYSGSKIGEEGLTANGFLKDMEDCTAHYIQLNDFINK